MQVLKSTGQKVTSLGNKITQTSQLSQGYNYYLIHNDNGSCTTQVIRDKKIKNIKVS